MECWTPEKEKKYLKMFGGDKEEVAKVKKKYNQNVEIDSRVEFILFIYNLQQASYPIRGNQLKTYQWNWLNKLKEAILEIQHEEQDGR